MSRRTRRIVVLAFVVVGTGLGVAAAFSDGVWQDLWLNLVAEAAGAAFIVLFIDRLLERSKQKEQDENRRAAIQDLRLVLRELQEWLVRLFLQSETAAARDQKGDDPDRVPVEAFLDGLPRYLGTIDFAAAGPYKRDRYVIEWARRSFNQTALELARWEQNFAGSAGLFDQDFRRGAEGLQSFIRTTSSFLEGMERYITRENVSSPVLAYQGITELTETNTSQLVSQLREFLQFYREQCQRYTGVAPELDLTSKTTAPHVQQASTAPEPPSE
jgi:hypothetical protein